jgi:hypothetical protein
MFPIVPVEEAIFGDATGALVVGAGVGMIGATGAAAGRGGGGSGGSDTPWTVTCSTCHQTRVVYQPSQPHTCKFCGNRFTEVKIGLPPSPAPQAAVSSGKEIDPEVLHELQMQLAKKEITPEQYQATVKLLRET